MVGGMAIVGKETHSGQRERKLTRLRASLLVSRFSGLGYPCTADRPSHGSLVDLEPQQCKPQLASCWYD